MKLVLLGSRNVFHFIFGSFNPKISFLVSIDWIPVDKLKKKINLLQPSLNTELTCDEKLSRIRADFANSRKPIRGFALKFRSAVCLGDIPYVEFPGRHDAVLVRVTWWHLENISPLQFQLR